MQLQSNDIHIWSADLAVQLEREKELLAILSHDERVRAARFIFPQHKRRFIAARGTLRQILHLYLKVPPQDIVFRYTEHQKPFLSTPHQSPLQFNLSHSDDLAAYAITLNYAIGIDIEKIRNTVNLAIAERYFSTEENLHLHRLPEKEQRIAFYHLWARKEALIKATGKGLSLPLTTFTVTATDSPEMVSLQNETWSLLPLSIHPDYSGAVASNQVIRSISYWYLDKDGAKISAPSIG